MSSTLYLIRHATPDWSRTDLRYDVPPGPPLTAAGEQEAVELGNWLGQSGLSKIYASPLDRTWRTAELVADSFDLTVHREDAVAEWRRDETEQNVRNRMNNFWQQVVAEATNLGPVALVSHGGPLRVLLESLGVTPAEIEHYRRQFDHGNPLPPAGVWRALFDQKSDGWQVDLIYAPRSFTLYYGSEAPDISETLTVNV